MKVTEKGRAEQRNFGSLSNGDLFRYEDDYYIKISTDDSDGANCVYLVNGATFYMDDYETVEIIEKYEFIVNE